MEVLNRARHRFETAENKGKNATEETHVNVRLKLLYLTFPSLLP